MPQLEFETYISQLFWLAISFAILVWVSFRVTLPRAERIMTARWHRIQGTFLRARQMKEEAERIQESLTAEETAARQTAHDMILKTAHELSVRGAARRWEITHKMNERFNALDHRILERKATLMGDVETLSSALTKEIVAKIIGQTADHDDVRRVVAASFDQRSGT